jgi:glyoxylase-like metal-dependent hydrolase (beta-lactamase superfamily II)
MSGKLRLDHVKTEGVFTLDGESFEVENNIWLVGDDDEVLVIDAAHDAGPIVEAVGDRRVVLIACTHGHNDHINAALDLHGFTGAPVALHPEDTMLWNQVYVARGADRKLSGGATLEVAGAQLEVLHTPGHSPGGVCFHLPDLGVVFSGDTLFQGGPGATGRSHSDFPTLVDSISARLLTLPPDTTVHTGHGPSTTIGDEAPHLQEWIDRGH